jgi:hypothetical protein
MDEIVLRGMAKWPNVPAVYGWLALDRRGNWLIKGERIGNPLVTEFIGRNYGRDGRGCWYFQNGPQRVFVSLDYAPLVLRVASNAGEPLALAAHTGAPVARVTGAWLDENGVLLLATDLGPGTVDDRDLERLLPHLVGADGAPLPDAVLDELLERARQGRSAPMWLACGGARVPVKTVSSREVPQRFGFVARPEPPAGEEVCR